MEWIGRALLQPDMEEPDRADTDLRHALVAIPEREGRILRVIYNHRVQPPRIVTAFLDRSAGRK